MIRVLKASDLRDALRAFCDSTYGSFSGFPTTIAAARQAWGDAFGSYMANAVEKLVPPGVGTSMTLTGVSGAFRANLSLAPGIVAAAAAADLAGAWAAGVGAVTAGPGYTDATGSIYTFGSFTNTSTQQDALKTALVPLFTIPGFSATDDLGKIADAMHAATTGLQAAVTIVVSGTPGAGTMGIE